MSTDSCLLSGQADIVCLARNAPEFADLRLCCRPVESEHPSIPRSRRPTAARKPDPTSPFQQELRSVRCGHGGMPLAGCPHG